MGRFLLTFTLLLSFFLPSVQAENTIKDIFTDVLMTDGSLPVDEAFKLSITVANANTLIAVWDIHKEYYLYRNKLNINVKGAKLGNIKLSKGKIKEDPLFGRVQIYQNKLIIQIPLSAIQSKTITTIVEYQGCWLGGVCYPPQTKTINIALPASNKNINGKTQKSKQSLQLVSSNLALEPSIKLNEADKISALLQQDNIVWVLISFFSFGLLLAFTPCVLPMVPILSGIIISQTERPSTTKAFFMSLVFVLTVSFVYAVAGVLSGYFGHNLQALLQTPWVLVMFSLIFIALAFSMFGYFELQLSTKLQEKFYCISNSQKNKYFVGVVIMGFLSALIIGPCITPVLAGALIYISQTGDALLGGLSLFFMSLGMGVPLILLGTGVSKLPKSGKWMEDIKHIFGILMLAVAIWLLERVITDLAALMFWAALLSIAPIAMGVLNTITNTPSVLQRIFKAIGLLILVYGILLWGLVMRGGGDRFAPLSGWGTSSVQTIPTHIKFTSIKSTGDLEQIFIQAKNSKQKVMLDFYADWCITCQKLERFVFSNVDVINATSNIITIRADVTNNDDIDKALIAQFNIIGPPAILFFKNGIENRAYRIVGDISTQDFLEHLNKIP